MGQCAWTGAYRIYYLVVLVIEIENRPAHDYMEQLPRAG